MSSCSHFSADPYFRNNVNGIIAKENVNMYECESVGRNILHRMLEKRAFSFGFKGVDKTNILSSSPVVTVAPGKTIGHGFLFNDSLSSSEQENYI